MGIEVPIIALTASGSPEQIQRCLDCGMNGHLLKPVSTQELELALARTFEQVSVDEQAPVVPPQQTSEEQARAAFEEEMGKETALSFVRMFQEQLQSRFKSEVREDLCEDAHKISGSAGLLGFASLGEAAARLEAQCKTAGPIEAEREAMAAALAEAQRTLDAWADRLARDVHATAA